MTCDIHCNREKMADREWYDAYWRFFGRFLSLFAGKISKQACAVRFQPSNVGFGDAGTLNETVLQSCPLERSSPKAKAARKPRRRRRLLKVKRVTPFFLLNSFLRYMKYQPWCKKNHFLIVHFTRIFYFIYKNNYSLNNVIFQSCLDASRFQVLNWFLFSIVSFHR